jgi:hypothetical protein
VELFGSVPNVVAAAGIPAEKFLEGQAKPEKPGLAKSEAKVSRKRK